MLYNIICAVYLDVNYIDRTDVAESSLLFLGVFLAALVAAWFLMQAIKNEFQQNAVYGALYYRSFVFLLFPISVMVNIGISKVIWAYHIRAFLHIVSLVLVIVVISILYISLVSFIEKKVGSYRPSAK